MFTVIYKNRKDTTTMSEQLSNRVLATPNGELIESEQMQEDRLQNMGKNEIETGWPHEKDHVNEQEMTEMAVAQIDEKMLGLEIGDMNNSNNTKNYNHLRDMRDFLIHMSTPEKGYAKVQELEQAGKKDEAEIARTGLDLASVISSEADGLGNTKPAIEEHNQRVQNNAKQRALIEQRNQIAGVDTRHQSTEI